MPTSKYFDAIEELRVFVEIAHVGLEYGLAADKIAEVIKRSTLGLPYHKADGTIPKAFQERMTRLKHFSVAQEQQGYPILYRICVVQLWSILESLARAVTEKHVLHPNAMARDDIQKFTGPVARFIGCDESERGRLLVELLEEKVASSLKRGVNRFESILAAVGLSGPVDETVRRVLYELSQVRNVVAHNNGVADRSFVGACPWFGASVGEQVVITRQSFEAYLSAAHWYLLELDARLRDPEDDPEEMVPLLKETQQIIVDRLHERMRTQVCTNGNNGVES